MKRATVRVTVDKQETLIDVFTRGTLVEVRDYNAPMSNGKAGDSWTDEDGRVCKRYFVGYNGKLDIGKAIADDLQRFAEDLNTHAGIEAVFEPTEDADSLHVLKINEVDYYFFADGGGYDGWGKCV